MSLTTGTYSQVHELSLTQEFENKPNGSLISRIAGTDTEGNIFSLRREQFTKTDYEEWAFDNKCHIEKHDADGILILSKPLEVAIPEPGKVRFNDLFMLEGRLYGFASVLTKGKNGKLEVLYSFEVSKDGDIDSSSYKKIAICNAAPNMGDLHSSYTFRPTKDASKILITRKKELVLFPKKNDAVVYFHTVVDAKMKVLWKKEIIMRKGGDNGSFYTFKEIDSDGNLIYSDLRDNKGSDFPNCRLLKYDFENDKLIELPIKLADGKKAISAKIEEDPNTGKLISHGYYLTSDKGLGCYFLTLNEDLTIVNQSYSQEFYTIKNGYNFSEHAWSLKTKGYFPVQAEGGYLVANTSVISPKKKGERYNQIVFKLDKNNTFEWTLPIKEGFVKSSFLSKHDIQMVHGSSLYLILNNDRSLSSLAIDAKGNVEYEILIDYLKNKKMIADPSTYFKITDDKLVLLLRKLLNATANSTHSQFGYFSVK